VNPPDAATRRAERLLRWYPKVWRSRYGDEFTELLISEISERPRSWARTLDVARGGIVARLTRAGLCGFAADPAAQVRASLVSLGCCLAVFLPFGAAMWSQLTIGWQWSAPGTTATGIAMVVMSAAMLAFLVLALLAAVPVIWSVLPPIARGPSADLIAPSVLFLAGVLALFIGGRHFGNGWPGTGGHPWAHRALVPGGLAAFSWASTMSVSAYWAHPSALAAFPAAEIAWMAVSPLAVASAVTGAAKAVRRADLSPGVLRFEIRLASAACAVMAVFLAGCCLWVVDGGAGQANLFHAGTIDLLAIAVLTIALAVARQAANEARRGGLRLTVR